MKPEQCVVFLGPTLSAREAQELCPEASFRPPVARGELYEAREAGASVLLMIDGVFYQQLAVSPREVIDVIKDGALLLGASSMGALRAAECWPLGMKGIGLVARLFKMGVLTTDDEVAVALDPEQRFRATSIALINIRYALARAVKARRLDTNWRRRLTEAAVATPFPQRTWPAIIRSAGYVDEGRALERFCVSVDLKRMDAIRALKTLRAILHSNSQLGEERARRSSEPFSILNRAPGYRRTLGGQPEVLRLDLLRWLFGSGRYQKYIWPLAAGEPELATARDHPEQRRVALATAMARLLADPALLAERLWAELQFLEEADAELMRMHAVHAGAEASRRQGLAEPPLDAARAVQEQVSIAHGCGSWTTLLTAVEDGLLFGAIPLEWISESCLEMALCRTMGPSVAGRNANVSIP